jgi:adenine-specific DNA methylase
MGKVSLREVSSSTSDSYICTSVASDGVINTTLNKKLSVWVANDLIHKNKVANSSSLIREIESYK